MDAQFLIPLLFIGFALAAAILALLAWWDGRAAAQALQDIAAGVAALRERGDNTERAIREEMKGMREESSARDRDMRIELGKAIIGSGESLQLRVGDMSRTVEERFAAFETQQKSDAAALKIDLGDNMKRSDDHAKSASLALAETQRERLDAMRAALGELTERLERQQNLFGDRLSQSLKSVTDQLAALLEANETKQTQLRDTLTVNLENLRRDNETKLEKMRETVEEKLQGTLEERIGHSFKLVSDRLESVQKGLGEMQTLASGVGDLKRVLANVKTRGGWAEVQLGAMLEDMLAPDQFLRNVKIKPDSDESVEYAVKLPGEDDSFVLLPIDAKFPVEPYEKLIAAQELGDQVSVQEALFGLESAIKKEARRIVSKYIQPGKTTEFAILYLPTEGLFAEVIRRQNLLEELQKTLGVAIAGPTTLAALLTSLRMGFRAHNIQEHGGQIWDLLKKAKAEFEAHGGLWEKLAKQLGTARNTALAIGVRSRAISKSLKDVDSGEKLRSMVKPLELDSDSIDLAVVEGGGEFTSDDQAN